MLFISSALSWGVPAYVNSFKKTLSPKNSLYPLFSKTETAVFKSGSFNHDDGLTMPMVAFGFRADGLIMN